jgi:DNA polymerase-3 subunit delta'
LSVTDFQILQEQRALRILSVFFGKENVPHALLFTGIHGVGKRTAALMFAMACNCRRFADGTVQSRVDRDVMTVVGCDCKACRKILSGNHPDIHRVAPSGGMIRIDRVRELRHSLSLKPYEASLRIVIVEQAQTMNPEASNALLKILEEPPDRTIFILTALTPGDLLPTIASRCINVRFDPVPRRRRAAVWRAKYDLTSVEADLFAIMAEGSPGRINMDSPADRKAWLRRRKWLLNRLSEITSGTDRDLAVNGLMAFAERLFREKALIDGSLDMIRSFLRDLIIFKHAPEKILNEDVLSDIRRISIIFTEKSLLSKIEAVNAAQKAVGSNANIRLTLEVMVLQLAIK